MATPRTEPEAPTVSALFMGFFITGITGFGGVLPLARRMIVDQRHWLTQAEFNDLLALCQFLPGPNICNMTIALGHRFRGLAGAVAATTGLLAAPMGIAIALGSVYARYGQLPVVRNVFVGLAAAASGLVLATALKIAWPIRQSALDVGLASAAFVAIALLHLPLLTTMAVLAPISVLLHGGRA